MINHFELRNLNKIIFVFIVLAHVSCQDTAILKPETSYMIFGQFGYCWGEECIEFFMIESDRLLESPDDDYEGDGYYDFDHYQVLSDQKFELVKDLGQFIPEELLNDPATHIGEADVFDAGSLFFEIKNDSMHSFWIFELGDFDMPEVYSEFMNKINEKISLINQ